MEGSFSPSSPRMLVDSSSVYTVFDVQLASNRYLEYYPAPVTMANNLNNKTTQLKAALSTFDSSYSIIATEF